VNDSWTLCLAKKEMLKQRNVFSENFSFGSCSNPKS
jgi:hypothetical protein